MNTHDPGSDVAMPAAVAAFDGMASGFDQRFGDWLSVTAQRAAVRRCLLRTFPRDSHILEIGGGTGEDAIFMAHHGRRVLLTDGSPAMVARAKEKVAKAGLTDGVTVRQLALEQLADFASPHAPKFDGMFSNFASLNCIPSVTAIGHPLARVLQPGAQVVFVMFGKWSVGEIVLHLLKGQPRVALRRFADGPVSVRLSGKTFQVWYPSISDVRRALSPWFRLNRVRGIGVFVPPSAAEPAISRFPRIVRILETLDRLACVPFARFADHVLLEFVRIDDLPE